MKLSVKKIIVLAMSLVLAVSVLAACGRGAKTTPGGDGDGSAAGGLRTGLAVISSIAKSTDAGRRTDLPR